MRSRKKPPSAAAEEKIGRTQDAIEIAVQPAACRTAAEAHRLAGSATSGRRSRCVLSTFDASARRSVVSSLAFTVKNFNGNALSISRPTNLNLIMAGPTSDYG
jgi:hypothetical protein